MSSNQHASTALRLAAAAEDIEVLLINLGRHIFALPISQVRYVAPMPADFVCCGDDVAKYFAFEGEPLTYVSLWDALGSTSQYAEYEELQTMLPQR